MSPKLPVIAIIGRPNVGKSTLFNRLAGRRIAIVSETPGTTRDRISTDTEWDDRRYLLIDTGGIEERSNNVLWENIKAQTERAVKQSDALILVVDASQGISPDDFDATKLARHSGKPCIVAANKADNIVRESNIAEFYSLGIGDPVPISAYHDRGISDLMSGVFSNFPFEGWEPRGAKPIRIAIVGRPNVGKSALFNSLTGHERSIVSPLPGTTRDTVDTHFRFENKDLTFLDTAGLRRRGRTEQGIEKYSAIRTISGVERSHVCILLLDASEFVTAQDTHVGGYINAASRSNIIVVNKWDLSHTLDLKLDATEQKIRQRFKYFPDVPILFVSALKNKGVEEIPKIVLSVYEEFTRRIKRADLSRILFDALGQNPPPSRGNIRPRIYRVTQTTIAPPTFVFSTKRPDLIHFSYHRYLENKFRAAFGFKGSPIKFQFTSREE